MIVVYTCVLNILEFVESTWVCRIYIGCISHADWLLFAGPINEETRPAILYLADLSQFHQLAFMTDSGKEFANTKLANHLIDIHINHIMAPIYIPVINGSVERVNRTIIEGTCSLMLSANVPITLVWSNMQHNMFMESMHPFDCRVSYLLSAPKRGGPSKLQPLTQEGVYLGFQLDKVIGHVIYDPIENDTLTTPHTYFNDNVQGFETQPYR